MSRLRAAFVLIAGIAAVFFVYTTASTSTGASSTSTTVPLSDVEVVISTDTAAPTPPTSTTADATTVRAGATAESQPADTVVSSSVAAASPLDTSPLRDFDHDRDHGPDVLDGSDTAVSWAMERYRSTWDPNAAPAGDQLAFLSNDAELVDGATARTASLVDVDQQQTVAGIVDDVVDLGDGWWRVDLTVKRTERGTVGVTSTPATVTVHVDHDGYVDEDTEL